MKFIINKNRDITPVEKFCSTSNENDVTELLFTIPAPYNEWNKKIVFIFPDEEKEPQWEEIIDDKYILTNTVTKYHTVKFYIWLTHEKQDFRTKEVELVFNYNVNADKELTEEEINSVKSILVLVDNELQKAKEIEQDMKNRIAEVDNINIAATKEGTTATIAITDKQGIEHIITISDGEDYIITEEDIQEIIDRVTEDINSKVNQNAQEKIDEYNGNAETKTQELNEYGEIIIAEYNENAAAKSQALNNLGNEIIDAINSIATTQINNIDSSTEEALENISYEGANQINAINTLAEKIQKDIADGKYNGKSAYELAVAAGFPGSMSEWLASLQGKDAVINGFNTLTMTAGKNINLDQIGSNIKIENTYEYDDTQLNQKVDNAVAASSANTTSINQIKGDVRILNTTIEDTKAKMEDKADKSEIPTRVGQLENNLHFIDKSVNDLVYYYLKSETYNKQEVNELIGAIKTISMKVLPERPTVGETNIIYLIPSSKTEPENIYDEWIYVNNKWEKIGTTEIDLSNYYTIEQINTILYDYITSNDLEETLKDYVTIATKYDFVKDGLINNTNQLNDEEKLKVESWLGLAENYLTYYNETPYNVNKDYIPAHKKYVDEEINKLDDRIDEIELFKFPNMTIIGTPTIQNGQVSNFTLDDYLEFPFLVDFRNRPFEINFAFTTGSNVTIQQNILDSSFGLAFAIKDGKTLMAISYNGISWSNQYVGSLNIEPDTTYIYRISWNGMLYKIQYYNGSEYVNDFYFAATQQPYPKQMFIGVSKLSNNYFEGSINLNYANLKIDGNIVWSGMDDAGLATRMAVDMDNIDNAGIAKINEIVSNSGYIKDTDYAKSSKAGVIKTTSTYGIDTSETGELFCGSYTNDTYNQKHQSTFVSKGTLENVIAGKGLTTKDYVDGLIGNIDKVLETIQEKEY